MPLNPLRLEPAGLDMSPLPISLSLIKEHCAIDTSDFDTLLELYLFAGIRWAEGAMHRSIYARSHSWVLQDFPRDARQEIRLPRGKTQSVQSIQYTANGSTTTLTGPSSDTAGNGYQEDLRSDGGGVVMPIAGATWPSVDYDAISPVVINFTAGWNVTDVPENITHALLFSISDAFELRGTNDLISSAGANLGTRHALISPFRLKRWY